MCDAANERRDGFTLIEVMIALALFALIGVAGFTLLDSVLRTQGATETRLARLAEVQRAMLVISTDLDQITGGLTGQGAALSLQKDDLAGSRVVVRYELAGTTLVRTVAGPLGERRQPLVEDVASLQWSFHRRQGDWLAAWPQPETPGAAPPAPVAIGAAPPRRPADGVTAVALDLTLTGLDGRPGATLRRVASTPVLP